MSKITQRVPHYAMLLIEYYRLNMISADLLEYLVGLLVGPVYLDDGGKQPRQYFSLIRYTDDVEEMRGAHVVIKPSGFFSWDNYGKPSAEPQLPLAEWEGVPLLFGEPRYEWINEGKTLLLHADLIASSYYLISRYEEMTHRGQRDHLGRFPGSMSLPARAGFIHRPIVDEYSLALRSFLERNGVLASAGLNLEPSGNTFTRIKLTHDICRPFWCRGIANIFKGIFYHKYNPFTILRVLLSSPSHDPYYTFDEIFASDKSVIDSFPEGRVQSALFMRTPSGHELDTPNYRLTSPYLYHILSEADKIGAIFGLLCSHKSSQRPRLIPEELKTLRADLAKVYRRLYGWFEEQENKGHAYKQNQKCRRDLELTRSRHSSLALGEPEDVRELLVSGIRHDYSMAYMDSLGFRLGTSRPVRFINPNTRELTDLIMHPISLNASVLINEEISHLRSEDEAYKYCCEVVDLVYKCGGELTLSWQTDLFVKEEHPWIGSLYHRLLDYISKTYGERKEQ